MAVKSSDQISIVDLTDGYSVILTSDGYTFPGGTSAAVAGSTTTGVIAMCGASQVDCNIVASEIREVGANALPAGVSTPTVAGNNGPNPVITISVTTSFAAAASLDIPVHVLDGNGNTLVTIHKYFAMGIAIKGAGGTAAYSALTGNDAQVIACDKDGRTLAATDIVIPYTVFQGTSRKAANVRINSASASAAANDAVSTGITVKSNTAGTTSAQGVLTLTAAADSTLGGEANGSITLHIYTGTTLIADKTFTWSKSITGATGSQGPQGDPGTNGASATCVICGNESAAIPCTDGGLTAAASVITIPFAGYIGTTRAACSVAVSGLPTGITAGTNTAATASADGSLVLQVASGKNLGNAATLTGEITLTFSCNSQTFVKKFTWTKANKGQQGQQGPQGDPGADAVTMSITSSAGTIFKNTAISTTLTAHVYKAGVELDATAIAALGTIRWYRDGSSTPLAATGTTLTIGAGDVTDKATFIAQLESQDA